MFRIDRSLVNISSKSLDLQAVLAPPPVPEEPEPPPEPEQPSDAEEKASGAEVGVPEEPDTSFIDEAREELARLGEELEQRREALEREVKQARERAEAESREKLEAAEVLAVEIKSNAWREGYDEGRRAAAEELERSLREGGERLANLLDEISNERARMFDGLETDAVELVLDIAKKVVDKAVLENEELFVSMAARAVRELRTKGGVTLRVSSEVCESFFPGGRAEFTFGDRKVAASVVPDSELSGAALVAETDEEMIDAGTDTQLRLISLSFLETAD